MMNEPRGTPASRPPLHRSYTRWWLVTLILVAVTEFAALFRRGSGDTLSEHVWALQARGGWEGAAILVLWAWLGWHLTAGAGRPLGWQDAVAAILGLALWYVVIYLRVRGMQ